MAGIFGSLPGMEIPIKFVVTRREEEVTYVSRPSGPCPLTSVMFTATQVQIPR